MNYRTFGDLGRDVLKLVSKLPNTIDLVVGIPRGGIFVGALVASYLNVPLIDLVGFLSRALPMVGLSYELVHGKFSYDNVREVLILDDSICYGTQMRKVRNMLSENDINSKYKFYYAVIYRTLPNHNCHDLVDYYGADIYEPYVFQWDIFNAPWLIERSCIDIDGVLCHDPSIEESQEPLYSEWMDRVKPYIRITPEIACLVTARLEKYRDKTEKWLSEHGVKYKKLVMRNSHGDDIVDFKSKVYSSDSYILFIESSEYQSIRIADKTKRDVYCVENNRIYSGDIIHDSLPDGTKLRYYYDAMRHLYMLLRHGNIKEIAYILYRRLIASNYKKYIRGGN